MGHAVRSTFRRGDRLPESDFVAAVRSPPASRAAHFRVHARPNGLGRSRLGVSVGRKFGGAVARNRFKRLVRESFRTSPEGRAAGLDIVVVCADARALERPEEIAAALRRAAARAGAAEGRDAG